MEDFKKIKVKFKDVTKLCQIETKQHNSNNCYVVNKNGEIGEIDFNYQHKAQVHDSLLLIDVVRPLSLDDILNLRSGKEITTKEELVKLIKKNFRDGDGDIDLNYLDFSGENVYIGCMTAENLYQNEQEVENTLYQSNQTVGSNLYQHNQKVGYSLHQYNQKVKGSIFQDETNTDQDETNKDQDEIKKDQDEIKKDQDEIKKDQDEIKKDITTKEELVELIKKNFRDEYGDIDLRSLDFSGENVYIGYMKAKNIFQSYQEVEIDLYQHTQTVEKDLWQCYQNVGENLWQNNQEVGKNLYQDNQDVKGKVFQDEPNKDQCETKRDNINPNYYKGKIECINAIEEITKDLQGVEAVATGTAIKYLWRWKNKNGVEDLKKARWYINRLIEINEIKTKKMTEEDSN